MKRCAVLTFGCKVNQHESQALQEGLRLRGFEIVDPADPADVYVLNTCTVTETAYAEAARVVRRIHRRSPQAEITVTGCAADSHGERQDQQTPRRDHSKDGEHTEQYGGAKHPRLTEDQQSPSIRYVRESAGRKREQEDRQTVGRL